MPNATDDFAGLRKGLLEYVLLALIAGGRLYVADMLARLADTPFATQEGTLYPLLSKLRRDALVDYDWVESEAGPPRKYYRLTEQGAQRLADLSNYWRQLNDALLRLGA
ncbi:MAG: PadR family transcriptional regulator [Hyphomonadaceae bacterium]|nr:PadR family transcriptional regulator [Hyphomonadaceae bacterium]